MPRDYFQGDYPELRLLLDDYLNDMDGSIRSMSCYSDVVVLALAGGYGRGEGGIFKSDFAAASLYNDLEFFLILKTPVPAPEVLAWIHEEEKKGAEIMGIDVEFKVLSAQEFATACSNMFYYDLVMGHKVVSGDHDFLKSFLSRFGDPSRIPIHEATRLLFNRGSGLLFSQVGLVLRDERTHNGFIERNHAKVKLALGDALLAVEGKYHFSCQERNRLLGNSNVVNESFFAPVMQWHTEGVDFKLHPKHHFPSLEALSHQQEKLVYWWSKVFLYIENIRLRKQFASLGAYAVYSGRLLPEFGLFKNPLIHLRDMVKRGGSLGFWSDYPRGALQRVLAHFLSNKASSPALARRGLHLKEDASVEDFEKAYKTWWSYYN